MRKAITKECQCRTRLILKTSLTPRNKNKAINELAVPCIPIQLKNNKRATIANEQTRYQNKETPHDTQNVQQKSKHLKNVPAEMRRR